MPDFGLVIETADRHRTVFIGVIEQEFGARLHFVFGGSVPLYLASLVKLFRHASTPKTIGTCRARIEWLLLEAIEPAARSFFGAPHAASVAGISI
jgi:hypothetical protein